LVMRVQQRKYSREKSLKDGGEVPWAGK